MGSKFLHRFLCLHNHHTRILANIHANDPVNAPSNMLCNLHYGVVNMFICPCSENPEVGSAVDVIVDHIDSVDDSSVCVWSGWWPEGWVGGWVDCVVDCGTLIFHDAQLSSVLIMQEVECWGCMATIYKRYKSNRITL